MNMQTENKTTSKSLTDRITIHVQELAEATDAALLREAMTRYLDTCAKFHQYSPHNIWLILLAKPDASAVAGFRKWQNLNRYVRRGEKGIPILAPIFSTVTLDDGREENRLVAFKVVYVFDVAQTDGEPLPEPPDWMSPQKDAELHQRLLDFASQKGITVQVKPLPGDTQGVSMGGKILLSPQAGTKTLIHELAHELLHQAENTPQERNLRELEAESVAYVVARHFGLDGLSSPNYIALHGANAKTILEHLERIRGAAVEIIKSIECVSECA